MFICGRELLNKGGIILTTYHYNPDTKEFLGPILHPETTTEVPAPPYSEGEIPVFDEESQSWILKPDNRWIVYYDLEGKQAIITKIGEIVPEGCTTEDPPDSTYDLVDGAWVLNLDKQNIQEISDLKNDLTNALIWQFRMILAIWDVGKAKALWGNVDITDTELKQKVWEWKTKLDRLTELGE